MTLREANEKWGVSAGKSAIIVLRVAHPRCEEMVATQRMIINNEQLVDGQTQHRKVLKRATRNKD